MAGWKKKDGFGLLSLCLLILPLFHRQSSLNPLYCTCTRPPTFLFFFFFFILITQTQFVLLVVSWLSEVAAAESVFLQKAAALSVQLLCEGSHWNEGGNLCFSDWNNFKITSDLRGRLLRWKMSGIFFPSQSCKFQDTLRNVNEENTFSKSNKFLFFGSISQNTN